MNKTEQPFEIFSIANPGDDGLEPLKAILPRDGSRGLVVGEDWEIQHLANLLNGYLQTKITHGVIPDYHEQLGTKWLTSGEAESFSGVPARTIRWAAGHGFILGAEKSGRDWRFPQRTFLYWVKNRPKPGRK